MKYFHSPLELTACLRAASLTQMPSALRIIHQVKLNNLIIDFSTNFSYRDMLQQIRKLCDQGLIKIEPDELSPDAIVSLIDSA